MGDLRPRDDADDEYLCEPDAEHETRSVAYKGRSHRTGSEAEKLAVFRRVRDEIRRVFEAYAAGRRDQMKGAASQ